MSAQVLAASVAWGSLAALTLAGAVGVVMVRETMRLVVALGSFLLGVAGFYLYYSMPMLAASQIFLYVGGVLVLFLFAIMALRRSDSGPELPRRADLIALSTCVALFAIMVTALREVGGSVSLTPLAAASTEGAGDVLLGSMLPQFEIVGVVLLVALVAALAITSGGEE
jgi:NADH:ubiquinone oxidoreductase subunit 6 (subunit J)